MHVMHLCSYYIGSKVYVRLFDELVKSLSDQSVFVPVRSLECEGSNKSVVNDFNVVYKNIVKPSDRLFYKGKIKKFVSSFYASFSRDEIKSVDLFHAHTLFTDGGLAYELNKLTGRPYVVSVRNTDVNYFLKYAIHLRSYVKSIIDSASQVVFISPSLERKFFQYFDRSKVRHSCIIPNGIDGFWFPSGWQQKNESDDGFLKILFVGDMNRNKNPLLLMRAFKEIQKDCPRARIKFVGGQGDQYDQIKEIAADSDGAEFVGRVDSKESLKDIYRWANVFAMVSHKETFGLVYVEALSQGVPLVYSRGQGFDGFFSEGEVGISCDPKSINDISSAIIDVFEHDYREAELVAAAGKFTWAKASNKYIDVYKKAVV